LNTILPGGVNMQFVRLVCDQGMFISYPLHRPRHVGETFVCRPFSCDRKKWYLGNMTEKIDVSEIIL